MIKDKNSHDLIFEEHHPLTNSVFRCGNCNKFVSEKKFQQWYDDTSDAYITFKYCYHCEKEA